MTCSRFCLVSALVCALAPSLAATTVLTFAGLRDGEGPLNFYSGGTGSLGSSNFNYGVSFGAGAVALVDSDAGGSGNFANAPSPFTVVFSTTGLVSVNVPAGFTEALMFYYVTHAGGVAGQASIYREVNGGGAVVGTAALNSVNRLCPGDPQGSYYGCWQSVTMPVAGLAKSVIFTLPALEFAIDNLGLTLPAIESPGLVVLPSATPEPGTGVGVAIAVAGLWLRRRTRG